MVQFLGHFFLDIISIVRPPGGTPCYCNLPCETEYQDAIIVFSEIKFCIELENMFSNMWHTIKCMRQWLRQVCLYYTGWLATISLFLKGEWVSVLFSCIIIVMKVWTIMWDEKKVIIIILSVTPQNINSKSLLSPPSYFIVFAVLKVYSSMVLSKVWNDKLVFFFLALTIILHATHSIKIDRPF